MNYKSLWNELKSSLEYAEKRLTSLHANPVSPEHLRDHYDVRALQTRAVISQMEAMEQDVEIF